MPCEICKSNVHRSYTHSRTSFHRKILFKLMKKKKEESIEKYGIFIFEDDDNEVNK